MLSFPYLPSYTIVFQTNENVHAGTQVWALAVAPGDDTLVMTGGAEGVINLWDDKTLEIDEDAFKKSQVRFVTYSFVTHSHNYLMIPSFGLRHIPVKYV